MTNFPFRIVVEIVITLCVKLLQLGPTLCDPMDHSPPGSSVHEILQEFSRQGYWSGLPFPSPGDLSNPGIEPTSPALAGGFFITSATCEVK